MCFSWQLWGLFLLSPDDHHPSHGVNSFIFCCNLCLNNQHPKAPAAAAAAAADRQKKD